MPPSSPRPKQAPALSPEVRKFRALTTAYLETSYELFPQYASELGLRQFDPALGQNDLRTHQAYGELLRKTLPAVEALPEDGFSGDDWLDRQGFLATLRTALFHHEREHHRINPQEHCDGAVNAIFTLLIRYAQHLQKALPIIESRLEEIPRFLQQGAALIRRPVPLWVKLAQKSCAGAESFLNDVEKQLAPLSNAPEKTAALFASARKAFKDYAAAIAKPAPGAPGSFAVGHEGLAMLIRERTGLRSTPAEITARGERLIAQVTAELATEARKHGKKKTSEILEEAAAGWAPREGTLLAEYQRVTLEMKERFERAGLVSFPQGERCQVRLVPEFLRHHFPTAAYNQPGAFDRDQTGIFWVNDLSLTHSDPAKQAAEVRQHFGLEFTCAHEAYPGHHLQFCIQNQHPSKIRRLFHHAIFYEGWTLWCEKMAVDQAVIKLPEARLIQLHDALWRAYRIGIDMGLQSGTLSYQAACRRLQEGVGFTAARAQGDVNWYTSSPTVPMSYLLGRLELERLHARRVGGEGWSLRQFNDWILSFGAIPWAWIWESELHGSVPQPK